MLHFRSIRGIPEGGLMVRTGSSAVPLYPGIREAAHGDFNAQLSSADANSFNYRRSVHKYRKGLSQRDGVSVERVGRVGVRGNHRQEIFNSCTVGIRAEMFNMSTNQN